jgi:hypothetical protein
MGHRESTRVYVAGPLSKGDVALNVKLAFKAATELLDYGYAPYVPHATHLWHMLYPQPYETWMQLDYQWLATCHAMLRLPGESLGADREEAFACECQIPVFQSIAELIAKVPTSARYCSVRAGDVVMALHEESSEDLLERLETHIARNRNGKESAVPDSYFQALVTSELQNARRHHAAINSLHEGWAVIYEELDELWDIARMRKEDRNRGDVLKELIQIAAMCQRTAEDLNLIMKGERPVMADNT